MPSRILSSQQSLKIRSRRLAYKNKYKNLYMHSWSYQNKHNWQGMWMSCDIVSRWHVAKVYIYERCDIAFLDITPLSMYFNVSSMQCFIFRLDIRGDMAWGVSSRTICALLYKYGTELPHPTSTKHRTIFLQFSRSSLRRLLIAFSCIYEWILRWGMQRSLSFYVCWQWRIQCIIIVINITGVMKNFRIRSNFDNTLLKTH